MESLASRISSAALQLRGACPERSRRAQNDRTLWVLKYPTPPAFSQESLTWTPNVERLTLGVEYHTRVTPGYRLLLRDVSQTGDAAYLPADHQSETMRSGRH